MGLSSTDDDGDIGVAGMAEQQSEQSSEQATKDKAQKAKEDLKKTQQDEARLAFWNQELQKVITTLIEQKSNRQLLSAFVDVFEDNIPEHILVGILSLENESSLQRSAQHLELAIEGRNAFQKHTDIQTYKEPIHPSLQKYINEWFQVLQNTIKKDPSQLATKKMLGLLEDTEVRKKIAILVQNTFGTFFYKQGIQMNANQAKTYAEFVLEQVTSALNATEVDEQWFASIAAAENENPDLQGEKTITYDFSSSSDREEAA